MLFFVDGTSVRLVILNNLADACRPACVSKTPGVAPALSQWPLLKGQLSTQRCNTGLLDPRTLTTSTSRSHTWTIATSPKNLSVTVFPVPFVGLSLKDTIPSAVGSCLTICSEWYKYIKSSKVAFQTVETLGAHWLMVTHMWCPRRKTLHLPPLVLHAFL